ncbi:Uncharacterized protein involved in cytokinesis%2C contains TGc (transglutaminase/protease-like) domain [[Ruminococcus] torques]|nr:Uncharacterized protein involved in cytokinesis%2C contains TGc (transglutaminase/protease-like) domain [[Ruminococcus] torques]
MKKRSKMLLSLFLSTIMVFSVVPSTVFAEPAHEETPAVQENTTEAVQDNTNTNEAEDPATEDSVTEDDATEATTDSSNTDNDAVAQTDNDENKVTISGITIQTPVIQFKGANAAVAEALTKDIKIDESDPAIQSLREALGDLEMVGGEAGTESNESNISTADLYEADEQAETKKLTADQINTVVGMYQQYLNQWSANANVLGVQNPFFLDFNDDTDGLGILGEMLALDGKSVQDVRDGKVSYDDLTGMIFTFTYGDKLGIKYYGPDVTNARDEALAAVTASGAQTKAQKLLVLNDWLAHNNTFDMSYIMNSGKESDDDKPMIAKDPQKQEHEDEVYNEIYKVYEPQIKQNFHDQIYAGIEKDLLVKFYKKAIAQTLVKAGQSEEDANAYVEANKEAIEKDPEAFVKENLPDVAEPLKQEADKFIKNAEEKGVEVSEGVTMTVEQLTQQQLDSATNQAATGMTTGVINYWEGTQFGAFGMGTSVCLGYSRAFSYLVQCLDKDIYLKDPSKGYDSKKTVSADDGTTSEVCDNWKTAKELYYGSDGKTLDINAGYTVDLVRISFQSNVTMYGEEQEDFGSDHYWNAVKVDGQWYYVDPCYTDVYTEVMSRDRVETDGDMNHVFFLFSDTDARKLYQGNFSVLRSLYQNEATDTTYEKAWMARAASNVYYADGYAYYMYDSTDLFDRVSSTSMNQSQKAAEYKIVRHKLTNKDTGDGDSDYETLINFTDKKNDDDDDTFVSVLNKDGKMEKNDLLTKLYAQFVDEQSIYPSIGLTAALYTDGKIYFNVSNDIVSYNPADGAVAVVKEYNTVSAKRDTTKLFGGMAFTTTDEKSADFTVTNHPIAGLTVKGDKLVVSIGTNFAFISGKSKLLDHSSYGYEFEETDYNPTYTNYKKYQQFMGSQSNDNDEFMWSANFVDTVDMKTLTGTSHNYETVSEPAYCGRNAFTEERCSDCGLIKAGTRVEAKNTAHEHHYIKFHETYYTKTDSGSWNEADNYVCPECGACITEPVKPKYEQANSTYEKRKAIWDEAQKNAAEGHAYTATDAEWSDDHTSVTFQNLKCETCANQINKLDCLLESDENATNKANRDSIEKALAEKVTATAKLVSHTGTCDQGVTSTYKATGKTDDGYRYTASDKKTSDAGQHQYTGTWAWEPVKDDNGNVTGYTASVTGVKCSVCDDEPKAEQITVADAVKDTEKSVAATCTEKGKDVYTATATVKDAEGKTEIGTLTDTYEVELAALGHKYGAPVWNWTKGENNTYTATATFTCANDEKHVETVDAKVTEKSDGATCTEAGKITYTAAVTFEGKDYTDTKTEEVAALGHNYGEPTWNWSKGDDGSYTAIATFTCDRCKDVQKVVATVGDPVETKATCTEAGKITYTAKVTFEGKDYTGTKTEEVAALGHDYKVSEKDGWKWTADKEKGYTAVATFVCSRCKDSHDVTADVVKEDKNSQIIYKATAKYTDKTGKEFTATATKSTKMSVSYIVHCQDYGWEEEWKKDGQTSGTVGESKRLEAIQIKLPNGVSGSIEYRTHIQDIGWEKNWSKNGEKSGTEGQCKRLEAIQIRLTGEVAENYDVYYSVHAENFGWLGWAKNGEEAGTAGYGYRLEAIKIQLVTKGDKAPELIGTIKEAMKARLVGYQTHVQDYGTQAYVYDGAMAGTEGECKRMESIRMKLPSSVNSSIQYRSHVQDIGWEKNWASNGSLSGTTGQCKRLEAIQIKLSGDVAKNYDVYYRVHAQDYGWLAWAKNGESSGTEGYAKRLEAIEVRLVPKGTTPDLPASANEKAFIKKK